MPIYASVRYSRTGCFRENLAQPVIAQQGSLKCIQLLDRDQMGGATTMTVARAEPRRRH